MRQKKLFLKVFLLTLIFLIFIASASSIIIHNLDLVGDNQLKNPLPVFQLTYDDKDTPITLVSSEFYSMASLEDMDPVDYYELIINTSEDKYFNFTPSKNEVPTYLFNGYYILNVYSRDIDGNDKLTQVTIELNASKLGMRAIEPSNEHLSNVAFANFAPPFNLTIETDVEAICKIGYDVDGFTNDVSSFNNLGVSFNQITPSTIHKVEVVDYNSATHPENQLKVRPVNYNSLESFVVACKVESGDAIHYVGQEFFIGYDETPPVISNEFIDAKITDPDKLFTIANIQSTEDLVVCSYDFTENPESEEEEGGGIQILSSSNDPFYDPENGKFYSSISTIYDFDDYTNYTFNFSELYDVTAFTVNEELKYQLDFTCENLAGDTTTISQNFEILLDRLLSINQMKKYFNTATQEHLFKSNLASTSKYRIPVDGEYLDWESASTSYRYDHIFTTESQEEGEYELEFTAINNADTYSDFYTYVIDMTAPSAVDLISNPYVCTADTITSLSITVDVNETNIDQFNFTLSNSTNIIFERLSSSTGVTATNVEGAIGDTFKWTVFAIDKAGNEGTKAEFTIDVINLTDDRCDTESPSATLNISNIPQGKLVTINCFDNVGCSPAFSYGYGSLGTCNDGDYADFVDIPYTTQNILLNNTKTLCYEVFDLNQNSKKYTQLISFITHCYDGEQNFDEEGIDCGGSCEAINSCSGNLGDVGDACVEDTDCFGDLTCHELFCIDPNQGTLAEGEACTTTSECIGDLKCIDYICSVDLTECYTDDDCIYGEECDYSGNCVEIIDEPEPVYEEDSNLLAWILIILGILIIAGGSYFIYYWRDIKAKEELERQRQQQIANQQHQEKLEALSAEERRKRLAEIQKRLKEGKEQRGKKLDARKKGRNSLLGAFDVDEEPVQKKELDEDTQLDVDELARRAKLKNQGLLDEGLETDYVDLSGYHNLTDKDPFSHLKDLSKQKKIPRKITGKGKIKAKPVKNLSSKVVVNKENAFSDLKSLNKTLNLADFEKLFKNKTLLTSKKPSIKKLDIDSFVDELYKNAMKNTKSKTKIHLDITTLRLLFKMLKDSGKLDEITKNDIMHRLLKRDLITEVQLHEI